MLGVDIASNLVDAGNKRATQEGLKIASFKKEMHPIFMRSATKEKKGRSDALQSELEELFNSHNKSTSKGTTSIPANYLRVTVVVN